MDNNYPLSLRVGRRRADAERACGAIHRWPRPTKSAPRQTPGRRRSWEQRQGQPRCRPRHGAVRDAVMTMVVRVADVADAGRMCAEDGGVTATVVVAMVTATVARAGCGEVVVVSGW